MTDLLFSFKPTAKLTLLVLGMMGFLPSYAQQNPPRVGFELSAHTLSLGDYQDYTSHLAATDASTAMDISAGLQIGLSLDFPFQKYRGLLKFFYDDAGASYSTTGLISSQRISHFASMGGQIGLGKDFPYKTWVIQPYFTLDAGIIQFFNSWTVGGNSVYDAKISSMAIGGSMGGKGIWQANKNLNFFMDVAFNIYSSLGYSGSVNLLGGNSQDLNVYYDTENHNFLFDNTPSTNPNVREASIGMNGIRLGMGASWFL